jgi:hypothetical protein
MGPLHHQTGRVFVKGIEVGTYILEDTREPRAVEFAMAGGQTGRKVVETAGEVRIMFTDIYDDDFREKLDIRRKREQRVEVPTIELLPDGEDHGPGGCVIGSGWGAPFELIERVPFGISIP